MVAGKIASVYAVYGKCMSSTGEKDPELKQISKIHAEFLLLHEPIMQDSHTNSLFVENWDLMEP
jgi:hypothetical protein